MGEVTTEAGRRLLDDIAPSLNPARCPLTGTDHVTSGGICHCGWSWSDPTRAGRRREGTPGERGASIAAIEAEAARQGATAALAPEGMAEALRRHQQDFIEQPESFDSHEVVAANLIRHLALIRDAEQAGADGEGRGTR